MKKQFALLSSLMLGVVLMSPAMADSWYEHHDHDHDGRWNYNEFRDAHNHWNDNHHGRNYSDRELQNHFNRFDRDHDGYVNQQQVRTFHQW